MLELASLGAKVLQIRSVEFGMKYGVPIHVRSSFNDNEGTWVVPEEKAMEAVVVAGVTATKDEAKITLHRIADTPGMQAQGVRPLADAGIVVDMIVQAYIQDGRTNLTFTVPAADLRARATSWSSSAATSCAPEQIKAESDLSQGLGRRRRHALARRRRAEDVRDARDARTSTSS